MAVRKAAAKATKKKSTAPVEDVEALEVDDAEEVEAKPAKKKAAEVKFGTAELVALINKETGSSYDSYNLRVILRKMVKDGILVREEAEGRSRYSFSGPNDPQVKAILKAIKDGYGESAKQERLDNLKAKRAEKPKAKKAGKKAAAVKKEAPVEVEDEDLEIEDDI